MDVERIIPNNTGVMVPQLESALGTAVSSQYNCIDGNSNTVCQVYKATVTNTGTSNVRLNGTISFNGINNLPNLKWKRITNATTIGEYSSHVATTSDVAFETDKLLTPSESMTYYFVIWIDETGSAQTDSGTFRVTVKFNSTGDGLTSTIKGSSTGNNNYLGALNEYGFYYNRAYSYEDSGSIYSYSFLEDGTVIQFINGEVFEISEADAATYGLRTISFGFFNGNVSEDGIEIEILDFGVTLVLENFETNLQFNQPYGNTARDTLDSFSTVSMTFDEDGTGVQMISYLDGSSAFEFFIINENNLIIVPKTDVMGSYDIILATLSENGRVLCAEFESNNICFGLGETVIEDGDYRYLLNGDSEDNFGWNVRVKDRTKTTYGNIKEEINGYPVVSMYETFVACTNLITSPAIPSTIVDMNMTFSSCTSLINAPVIPSTVVNMTSTFSWCTSLTGNVEINANPTRYGSTFYATTQPITITGSSSTETKSGLAATANNNNVSY